MSLITQCPACSTMFRVVPDQLRISEGWVRCGNCDEVFDANSHLGTLDESTDIAAQPPAAPTELSAPPDKVEEDYNYDLGAAWDNPGLVDPGPVALAFPEPDLHANASMQEAPAASLQGMEPLADLHAFEPSAETTETPAYQDEAPAAFEHSVEAEALAPTPNPIDAPTVAAPDSMSPSFMRATAKPRKRWISNGMAATLGLLLLLVLLVQVARQERDRLAASAPALRPVLVAGCEWLACSVAPMREIESIAIDSSAFTSVRTGVYLLSVTLKNTAATDLAAPALELTLTDMQDQPVVRRVLLAADWSGKPSAEPLLAGAERTAKLPISVPPDAVPHKITGYKLLAFYP